VIRRLLRLFGIGRAPAPPRREVGADIVWPRGPEVRDPPRAPMLEVVQQFNFTGPVDRAELQRIAAAAARGTNPPPRSRPTPVDWTPPRPLPGTPRPLPADGSLFAEDDDAAPGACAFAIAIAAMTRDAPAADGQSDPPAEPAQADPPTPTPTDS
jgi:hypothetical protein